MTRKLTRRKKWFLALPLALLIVLPGCQSLGFYGQAIKGQCNIYFNQRPIEVALNDPKLSSAVKDKLKLVLDLRQFAEKELSLEPNGHYLKYADLNRRFVVWNVHAAPEFSLEPTRWWYPVVGRLKYRGYFSEKLARKYAAGLEKEGYDVFVGGVEAYSTLGFFRDPVLNTFIHHTPADLAEIIFHELSHQRVFAKGDTDFNEAFATAVGEEGVRRWLHASGNTNALQEYLASQERTEQFVGIITEARAKLEKVYGDFGEARGAATVRSDAVQHQQKQQVLTELKEHYAALKANWGGYTGYDRWFARPINNAQLNTVAAYYDLVPEFRRLLERHQGNLGKFYETCEGLAKMKDKDQRHAALKRLTGET
jgi:predicted aminopeptidase